MAEQVTVREAALADVGGIQDVSHETWHEVYDDILGADTVDSVLDDLYVEEALEASVEDDSQDLYVAVDDEQVVGFAHAGPHPPLRIFRLYRIFLRETYRRQGIGTHLLARIEEELVDRDRSEYDVLALGSNPDFVAFLEASGFERVGSEETDRRDVPVTEIRYKKRI
jgi:GNAT superfamily N-acetyltransferase